MEKEAPEREPEESKEETVDGAVEEDAAKEETSGKEPSEEEVSLDADGTEETSEKPQKLFGKKKEKKSDKLQEKLKELEDQRIRQLAEFENFRKRSEKEKSQMFEIGAKTVVEKILPVMDNFERGLSAIPEEEKESSFVQGMELVYKQLLTAFEELGVTPIEAVGKEFDPNLHNAVMMVDDDSLESGVVAEEMQKGYMYKESVVRHSMVKVTN
ncbi:MAG: nucleotide exchange factor GrpE [Lachnospiraceae bacterium]|nr:nucleotide exchange factor GrpE [Lachnospiraceae bacterium]